MSDKPLFRRSEQTQKVVDLLLSVDVGATIPWGDLSEMIEEDAQEEGSHHVARARRIVRREAGRVFGAEAGVGIKYLTDAEVVNRGGYHRRRMHNITRLAGEEYDAIAGRVKELPEEERLAFLANRQLLTALQVESSSRRARDYRRNVQREVPAPETALFAKC